VGGKKYAIYGNEPLQKRDRRAKNLSSNYTHSEQNLTEQRRAAREAGEEITGREKESIGFER